MAKRKGDLEHDNSRNEPLTDDEMHALTLQHKKKYESALAKKKAADADLKNVCKLLKSELGDHGLADIKDMIASENDESFEEKIQAEIERKARIGRWLGLDLGAQADLFGESGGVKPPLADRAFDEGKRAGLAGEVCKPSYDSGGEAYQKYVEGWHSGQAVLASQIKKKETAEAPLIVNAEREESSVDEFDEAASGQGFGEGSEDDESETEKDEQWPDDKATADREAAETL